ncbi:MAG: preprotein translocase subunit SecG [Clostridia bacterium]|nr:preprotein translocase subunit SecG [Clostridia bacterium]
MLNFAISAITADARRVISEVLIILMTVISIAIIVIVMMQEGETGGVSAISGGSNDTYYGKNKGRSREQILKRLTLILGAVMLVLSVVFFIIKPTAAA